MTTIEEHIRQSGNLRLPAEEAILLLSAITTASININKMVNRAGLLNILGAAGSENIQGEAQQKLDVIANDEILKAVRETNLVAAVASEEDEHIVETGSGDKATYLLAMDPLDGSSNIDVNVSIGTIFSVYKRTVSGTASENEFYRKGSEQVLAGYVIYGTSTMLVFSAGDGDHGFTLDREKNQYLLSHGNMRMPNSGKIYSINEGNVESFQAGIKEYLDYCHSANNDQKTPYSARYIGSMVADFHRNLLKGGIFMYPGSEKAPNGKLRLLYECHPMAFLAEQAGGKAHSGYAPVLEISVETLHQRIPVFLGPTQMVDQLLSHIPSNQTA